MPLRPLFHFYSHFKQVCNIRLHLQTLSWKGIERLQVPKKCRILNRNDYIVFLLITGYNLNPSHQCMDNSPIPQNP